MATISYKYIPLGDPEATNNQSRGLSYQFNGYAPVTFVDSVYDYLLSLPEGENVPDFPTILKKCRGTVLFKDLSYVAADGIPVSNSSDYDSAVSSPGSHMFQDLTVEAADEMKLIGEDRVPHGSTVIEVPLSDTMMGDRLNGKARIDAVVLYGQAYNLDFYSKVQQGSIERTIAIGIVLFDSNKPEIDPGSGSKAKSIMKLTLGISSRSVPDVVYENESFDAWKKFAGVMHVVNDDLLTTSSFVIRGHDVEPMGDVEADGEYAEQIQGGEVVDFNSRVFFTNDLGDGINWDRNVDFGSPAKLTVLTRSEPTTDESRLPQTVIGKVKYTTDSDGYKHGCLEGIHQSFFEYSGSKYTGDVLEKDWFAKKKPAINLFSDSPSYTFSDPKYADYLLKPGNKTPVGREYDVENYESNSACFAGGNQLFSKDTVICGNGTAVNTYKSVIRGNSLVLNSSDVKSFSKATSEKEYDKDQKSVMYDTFVANSDDIKIYNRVKGSSDPDWGKYQPIAMNTVLNSRKVGIDNTKVSDPLFGPREYGRNIVAGCSNLEIEESDMNLFLGVKGQSATGTSVYPSRIRESKDSVYIGGSVTADRSMRNVVVSLGYKDPGVSEYLTNTIEKATKPSGEKTYVKSSLIIGKDCHLTTSWPGEYWRNSASSATTIVGDESDVIVLGKSLVNDIRQTASDPNGGPTIILGSNNQQYYQDGYKKHLVLGSRHYRSEDIGSFNYNPLEVSTSSFKTQFVERDGNGNSYQVWNAETASTLTDIKGRTVDYGSCGIQLGFLKGRRSDASYGNYNFFNCGRINLFKLYSLLQRIKWIPDTVYDSNGRPIPNAGYLVFDSSMAGGDDPTGSLNSLYTHRSSPWNSWAYNPDANGGNGAWTTCLADLVDDNTAKLKFAPQKPKD